MTDPHISPDTRYRIMRKGSRYNILGPHGRIFMKYKSASIVGPRWEELTHTPWPYASSAYEAGMRLWELGLIKREQVGQHTITKQVNISNRVILMMPTTKFALPAPQIDLRKQQRLMQALRRDPALIFDPQVRQALQHEVEYHRPAAQWAQHLLNLLARYEARERKRCVVAHTDPALIMAKHIAWQKQQAATL